jgi:hypothetical protein
VNLSKISHLVAASAQRVDLFRTILQKVTKETKMTKTYTTTETITDADGTIFVRSAISAAPKVFLCEPGNVQLNYKGTEQRQESEGKSQKPGFKVIETRSFSSFQVSTCPIYRR